MLCVFNVLSVVRFSKSLCIGLWLCLCMLYVSSVTWRDCSV